MLQLTSSVLYAHSTTAYQLLIVIDGLSASTICNKMILCKCSSCDAYTLEETCPHCGAATRTAHPARFSPDDKYSEQRVRFLSRFPGSSLMTSPAFTF